MENVAPHVNLLEVKVEGKGQKKPSVKDLQPPSHMPETQTTRLCRMRVLTGRLHVHQVELLEPELRISPPISAQLCQKFTV